MKHIVYKTTNNVNGKVYIGKHSTEDVNDYYLGSGTALKAAIEKYGIDNFSKEILYIFDTEDEAFLMEANIVTKEFVERNDTYNLVVGGSGSSRYGYYDEETGDYYEHAMQCKSIVEKAKQTNMERYGVEYTLQVPEIRERGKATMLRRYGVRSTLEIESNRLKCVKALESKYGSTVPLQNELIKEKHQNTMKTRHGFSVPLQNAKIKEKYDNTILQKYGVDHIMKVDEIRERSKAKREETMLQRYGSKSYMPSSQEIEALRERNKQNNTVIHGGTVWTNNGVVNKKFKKTEALPDGFVVGKLESSIKNQSEAARNRPKKECPCCFRLIDSSNYRRHLSKCLATNHTLLPFIQADETIDQEKYVLERNKI